MRRPSFLTRAERWAWWEAAVAGEAPPVFDDLPQSGFFKIRRWRAGPYVPAAVLWEPPPVHGETGELVADEMCWAEIDGWRVDPWESWMWLAKRPVRYEEWLWLRAMSTLSPRPSRSSLRPWWERSAPPPM